MVHSVKIGGENGRFASARSGSDFYDRVAVFIFIRRQQRYLNFAFEIGYPLFELRNLVVSDSRDLNIA
jgi:hypothetical protein